ncbi:MAG: hypothetical protein NPIRA04_13850 [Nitrospirales bacterium]|nr:MAG: hypothetical protein NPIRA04_13850 [Nitrospirales bacterium]
MLIISKVNTVNSLDYSIESLKVVDFKFYCSVFSGFHQQAKVFYTSKDKNCLTDTERWAVHCE